MHTALFVLLAALTVQSAAPAQPPAQPPARKPSPPARPTMTVTVTDLEGKTLPDVWVKATGPVDRETATDASGQVTFRNMSPGTYRLRFEHDDFVMFEREVAQTARALAITVALNAAPPRPEAPPPPPPDPVKPSLPPAGPPTSLSIPDFFERKSAPDTNLQVGCAPDMSASLMQIREPLAQHTHDDSDEMLYVVGGEGIHKVGGRDVPLEAGVLSVVPRGTPHSITRRGGRPVVVLSILSGPCAAR